MGVFNSFFKVLVLLAVIFYYRYVTHYQCTYILEELVYKDCLKTTFIVI